MTNTHIEKTAMRKIWLHILPFAMLAYFLAYLDKINVGFAALTMRSSLSMSATEFGFATGLFFWTYVLFEVPSNFALQHFGARKWLARIMITWGLASAATMFAWNTTSYAIFRLLLGAAEAGLYPGILLYLTYWFPKKYMSRAFGWFTIALTFSPIVGAPLSTALMSFDSWFGLAGWQIMFFVEALPAIILGIITLWLIQDSPKDAKWLTAEEKEWVTGAIDSDSVQINTPGKNILQLLITPSVMLILGAYISWVIGSVGLIVFLPQIIKSIDNVNLMTVGWLSTIPYLAGACGLVIMSWTSDKLAEYKWHVLIGFAITAIGFLIATLVNNSLYTLIGLTVASFGMYGKVGSFWSACKEAIGIKNIALGLALINSIGNLGGFFGPWFIGLGKDTTGTYHGSLAVISMFAVLSVLFWLAFIWNQTSNTAKLKTEY